MTATLHQLPVPQPQPAPARVPFPVMTPAETAEFWEAVAMLRAERALSGSAAAGSAAILAASRCACDRNGPCRYPLCRTGAVR